MVISVVVISVVPGQRGPGAVQQAGDGGDRVSGLLGGVPGMCLLLEDETGDVLGDRGDGAQRVAVGAGAAGQPVPPGFVVAGRSHAGGQEHCQGGLSVFTVTSADGTDVRAYDEGQGPAILVVGPGLDDGTRTGRLAAILARRFRVLRLCRRQYRLDLKGDGGCSIEQEVADVLAVARAVGGPVVGYGHSSGGVVALEAMAAAPEAFAGGVIFEPAAVIGPPLAGPDGAVITRARAALAAGRPGRAMAIFTRDTIRLPVWQAALVGGFVGLSPRYRRLAPCQIDDLEALDRLGVRLDTYATITAPVLLLGGDRSPAHIRERLDAVRRVIPHSERVVMRNRDHGADLRHAAQVAEIIAKFADSVR